jgi:hypothetical protein
MSWVDRELTNEVIKYVKKHNVVNAASRGVRTFQRPEGGRRGSFRVELSNFHELHDISPCLVVAVVARRLW